MTVGLLWAGAGAILSLADIEDLPGKADIREPDPRGARWKRPQSLGWRASGRGSTRRPKAQLPPRQTELVHPI